MFVLYEEFAREKAREAEANAAVQRMARRAQSAQRWQRVAAWAAHRLAMAQRESHDAHDALHHQMRGRVHR